MPALLAGVNIDHGEKIQPMSNERPLRNPPRPPASGLATEGGSGPPQSKNVTQQSGSGLPQCKNVTDEDCAQGTRNWPHAPPHRLALSGVYIVTARAAQQRHLLAS